MNEGEVVSGELVIERGAAPTLLNLVEELLRQISGATEEAAEADWLGPVPLSGAVCPRAHGPVGATIELSAVSERGRYEGAEDATIQDLRRYADCLCHILTLAKQRPIRCGSTPSRVIRVPFHAATCCRVPFDRVKNGSFSRIGCQLTASLLYAFTGASYREDALRHPYLPL